MTTPTNNNPKKSKHQEYLDHKDGAKTEIKNEYEAAVNALYAELRKAAASHLENIESLRKTLAGDFNTKLPKLKLGIPKEGGSSKGRSKMTPEQKEAIIVKAKALLSNGKELKYGAIQTELGINPIQFKDIILKSTSFDSRKDGVTKFVFIKK
jgi:hypothetical protein